MSKHSGQHFSNDCPRVLLWIGLAITCMPIRMLFLDPTMLENVETDIVVTSFVVVFTYVDTLGYDRVFLFFPERVNLH